MKKMVLISNDYISLSNKYNNLQLSFILLYNFYSFKVSKYQNVKETMC